MRRCRCGPEHTHVACRPRQGASCVGLFPGIRRCRRSGCGERGLPRCPELVVRAATDLLVETSTHRAVPTRPLWITSLRVDLFTADPFIVTELRRNADELKDPNATSRLPVRVDYLTGNHRKLPLRIPGRGIGTGYPESELSIPKASSSRLPLSDATSPSGSVAPARSTKLLSKPMRWPEPSMHARELRDAT